MENGIFWQTLARGGDNCSQYRARIHPNHPASIGRHDIPHYQWRLCRDPWITGYIGDRPGVDRGWPKLDIRKQNLALVKKGMDKTVNGKQGTAYKSRFEEPGLSMGGKTGTSQVRRITMEERREGISNADLPWKQRHHALFVGYAPVGNPRYACAVVIEHGGSGSAAAAPLARDILKAAQKRDPASTPLFQDKASTVAGYALPPSRKPVSRE